jgi:RNA polymerase sigma-70 factor (ECF subfamily)
MNRLEAILPPALGFARELSAGDGGSSGAAADADARWVEEFLRTGREEAFERLVDGHKEKVFRLALAILGPGFEVEAEEVAQETFVTAFRQLPAFRKESRFGTWLYRIAQRKAIDLRRSARLRHPHATAESLDALPGSLLGASLGEGAGSAEARAAARESQGVLLAAIRELPDPYPAVLRLFYWLDWTVAEIAESLDAAPGTVKSHLFRAREALHKKLKKKGLTDGRAMR